MLITSLRQEKKVEAFNHQKRSHREVSSTPSIKQLTTTEWNENPTYVYREPLGTYLSDEELSQILRKPKYRIAPQARYITRPAISRAEKLADNFKDLLQIGDETAKRIKERFKRIKTHFVRKKILLAVYILLLEDELRQFGIPTRTRELMREFEILPAQRRKARKLIWEARDKRVHFVPRIHSREEYEEMVTARLDTDFEKQLASQAIFTLDLPHLSFEDAVETIVLAIKKLTDPLQLKAMKLTTKQKNRVRKYVKKLRPLYEELRKEQETHALELAGSAAKIQKTQHGDPLRQGKASAPSPAVEHSHESNADEIFSEFLSTLQIEQHA